MVLTRADLESRLVELSSNFSKLTGYEQIEALKDNVAATGASGSPSRLRLRD
jgi:molybdate-binding protein